MDTFDRSALAVALNALGSLLASRGHRYEVVLIGGGNLLLRGIITRPTKDGDLLGERQPGGSVIRMERLPPPLMEAISDVATTYGLKDDWLNLGPGPLLDHDLPSGFESRLERRDFDGGLTVWLAGEYDLICFKLYAAAAHWPARDRHLEDLRKLKPTRTDLLEAARWSRRHDPSPGYRTLLVATLVHLGLEDADDVLDR
ncbi:MAG: hypothetical protein MUQ32_03905 [Chloroflexi bacterium]|nr:hypothetical protein [Chloroflexota bacterium]